MLRLLLKPLKFSAIPASQLEPAARCGQEIIAMTLLTLLPVRAGRIDVRHDLSGPVHRPCGIVDFGIAGLPPSSFPGTSQSDALHQACAAGLGIPDTGIRLSEQVAPLVVGDLRRIREAGTNLMEAFGRLYHHTATRGLEDAAWGAIYTAGCAALHLKATLRRIEEIDASPEGAAWRAGPVRPYLGHHVVCLGMTIAFAMGALGLEEHRFLDDGTLSVTLTAADRQEVHQWAKAATRRWMAEARRSCVTGRSFTFRPAFGTIM